MMIDRPHGDRRSSTWRIAGWSAAAALLLTPLVAMQFTPQMAWTGSDFALFGAMLLVAGGVCELAVRRGPGLAYRAGVAIAVTAAFVLVWANLAVGIIGSEREPINAVFFGVPAVGLAGATLVRGRARGMIGVMIAMVVVQTGAAVYAEVSGQGSAWGIAAAFDAIWIGSAWLFAKAAREGRS